MNLNEAVCEGFKHFANTSQLGDFKNDFLLKTFHKNSILSFNHTSYVSGSVTKLCVSD